jgi:hypothetical protein
MTIGGIPNKLSHKDTLGRMTLVEAEDVVNDVLQAKTKHTCRHGGGDNTFVY